MTTDRDHIPDRGGQGKSFVPFIPLILAVIALAVISVGISLGWPTGLYSSVPMLVLWGLVVLSALYALVARGVWRRPVTFGIHVSLIVVLAGALLTHYTASETTIHLRVNGRDSIPEASGLDVRLVDFRIETYPGTSTPRDFVTQVADGEGQLAELRMNRAATLGGWRLLQSQFDSDGGGVVLDARRDRWGTPVTYVGYILLGVTFLLYFLMPGTMFRNSLVKLRRAVPVILLLMVCPHINAAKLTDSQRDDFMKLMVLHNGRVTSLSTLAADFTSTVTGGRYGFDGISAPELFCDFLFDFGSVKDMKLIKVKDKSLKQILSVSGSRASYTDYIAAISSGRLDVEDNETVSRYAADIARFEAINMLVSGELLKIYPVWDDRGVEWFSPVSVDGRNMDSDQWVFIRKSLGYINEAALTGDHAMAGQIINGIHSYQVKQSGIELPGWKIDLESFYMRHASGIPLLVVLIVCAVILAVMLVRGKKKRFILAGGYAVTVASFCWLTSLISMRWIVSGYVPLANGFETMQFMAWLLLLGGVVFGWRYRTVLPVTMFAAGLALGVAAMSGAAKTVGTLMPVLSSPLLSVHVALVMAAYALLLLLAINGGVGLCVRNEERRTQLMWLGRVMLYPSVFLLAAGIFVGAVWADVSWGEYWSWDPKETWALITMLVYSLAMHPASLRALGRPRVFHLFMLLAFVTVLMTYFGVNFYLGGQHSYAG